MKNYCTLLLCLITLPLWAEPDFADLDSWQLPDANATQAAPAPKPVKTTAKKATQRTTVRRAPAAQEQEQELVIEMSETGQYKSARNSHDPNEIYIMNKSAKQLASMLENRGRFYVIFNANIPYSVDTLLETPDGTRYAFVRFGKEEGPYRKFLFEGEGDQTLLAVADDLDGTLSIFTRYGVNLEITPQAVQRAYPRVAATALTAADHAGEYTAYVLPDNRYLIFKNKMLERVFPTKEEYDAFTKDLATPKPAPVAAVQTVQPPVAVAPRPRRVRKALVEGGTIEDKMTLPQVTDPSAYDGAPLPPLTPSGPQAGTPLIRDVDGHYMNR